MASSTAKKVIIRRFDRENLNGFINPLSYLQAHNLELLKPDGSFVVVPYDDIKDVCFVRDFEGQPESRRIFHTRPKVQGLWVRMQFRDGEIMDGVMPNNLLACDIEGFTLTPPESDAKVFIPRQALRAIQVLGVIGSGLRAKRRRTVPAEDEPTLF